MDFVKKLIDNGSLEKEEYVKLLEACVCPQTGAAIREELAAEAEKAVDEMMLRTSTTEAPWHIIEANSKLYARIKVLEIVVEALEKRLE